MAFKQERREEVSPSGENIEFDLKFDKIINILKKIENTENKFYIKCSKKIKEIKGKYISKDSFSISSELDNGLMDSFSGSSEIDNVEREIDNLLKTEQTIRSLEIVLKENSQKSFEEISDEYLNKKKDKTKLLADPLLFLNPTYYSNLLEINDEIEENKNISLILPDFLYSFLKFKKQYSLPEFSEIEKTEELQRKLLDNLVEFSSLNHKMYHKMEELKQDLILQEFDRKIVEKYYLSENEDTALYYYFQTEYKYNSLINQISNYTGLLKILEEHPKIDNEHRNGMNSDILESFSIYSQYLFQTIEEIISKQNELNDSDQFLLGCNLILHEYGTQIKREELEALRQNLERQESYKNRELNKAIDFSEYYTINIRKTMVKLLRIYAYIRYSQNLLYYHPSIIEKLEFIPTSKSISEVYKKLIQFAKKVKGSVIYSTRNRIPALGRVLIDIDTELILRHRTENNTESKLLIAYDWVNFAFEKLGKLVTNTVDFLSIPTTIVKTGKRINQIVIFIMNRKKFYKDIDYAIKLLREYLDANQKISRFESDSSDKKIELSVTDIEKLLDNEKWIHNVAYSIYNATDHPMCFNPKNETFSVLKITTEKFNEFIKRNEISESLIERVYKMMKDPILLNKKKAKLIPSFGKNGIINYSY